MRVRAKNFVSLPTIINYDDMKSKITYSTYVNVVTWGIIAAFFAGCILSVHEKPLFLTLLSIYVILLVMALLCGPAYIKASPDAIVMGCLLRRKKILMRNVVSAELFQPTMGALRICGSGGFMGYWGVFREGDVGMYRAFYGRSSDCFLVRMKNGDKYVLGCQDPAAMVEYIKSHIQG